MTRSPGANADTPSPVGNDRTGSLVTEDPRTGKQIVLDFFQVRVADAACFDADQQLSCADLGRGHFVYTGQSAGPRTRQPSSSAARQCRTYLLLRNCSFQ